MPSLRVYAGADAVVVGAASPFLGSCSAHTHRAAAMAALRELERAIFVC